MPKLVYLAGGMEYAEDGKSWRKEAAIKLAKRGFDSWDPYVEESKFFDSNEIQEFIKNGDKEKDFIKFRSLMNMLLKHDLKIVRDVADIVLVRFDKSVLSGGGTKSELSIASLYNKPAHVWLCGLSLREVPTWCIGSFSTVSYTLDETIEVLSNYDL